MTEPRCPRCHRALVERIELGDREPWWCTPCELVVLDDQAVRVPLVPERKDLA